MDTIKPRPRHYSVTKEHKKYSMWNNYFKQVAIRPSVRAKSGGASGHHQEPQVAPYLPVRDLGVGVAGPACGGWRAEGTCLYMLMFLPVCWPGSNRSQGQSGLGIHSAVKHLIRTNKSGLGKEYLEPTHSVRYGTALPCQAFNTATVVGGVQQSWSISHNLFGPWRPVNHAQPKPGVTFHWHSATYWLLCVSYLCLSPIITVQVYPTAVPIFFHDSQFQIINMTKPKPTQPTPVHICPNTGVLLSSGDYFLTCLNSMWFCQRRKNENPLLMLRGIFKTGRHPLPLGELTERKWTGIVVYAFPGC